MCFCETEEFGSKQVILGLQRRRVREKKKRKRRKKKRRDGKKEKGRKEVSLHN